MQEAVEQIQCQQLFTSRHGSQYFAMRRPEESAEGERQEPAASGEALWAQVHSRIAARWVEIEKKAQNTIQEGEKVEVNPWLERTQWHPYLSGL